MMSGKRGGENKQAKKTATPGAAAKKMAVGQGFEPREALASTVFKTAAFDHSASPPNFALYMPHRGVSEGEDYTDCFAGDKSLVVFS